MEKKKRESPQIGPKHLNNAPPGETEATTDGGVEQMSASHHHHSSHLRQTRALPGRAEREALPQGHTWRAIPCDDFKLSDGG